MSARILNHLCFSSSVVFGRTAIIGDVAISPVFTSGTYNKHAKCPFYV